MPVKELDPKAVEALLMADKGLVILDVREKWEYDIVHLPNAQLMPLSNFTNLHSSLEKDKTYVIYCHHGVRSMQACMYLNRLGFNNLYNLSGGIDAYAMQVDNTLPLY